MTTSKYLDSVLKIMPAVQARQIADLLKELQATGAIRNATEYTTKLRELSSLVNGTDPQPSFIQISAIVLALCSSDAHNIMMQSFKNDLEAAFLQVDEIGSKLDEHNELLMKNMIADLERALKEQENHILKLELLADRNNEFSRVVVNSFTSASLLQTPRNQQGATALYFDNRTYEQKNSSQLPSALVSEHGEKLLLNTSVDPIVLPIAVLLHTDEHSYASEVSADINNPISNIIDRQRGTFWFRNIYLKTRVPKVTTVLEFDLGNGKDINYVIIEGATQEPFFVEKIEGITPDGHRVSLSSLSQTIEGIKRIDFTRTFLKSVKITFAVKTAHNASAWTTKDSAVHEAIDESNKFNKIKRKDSLSPATRKALNSKQLADKLNVPDLIPVQLNHEVYSFGLDNVWFGNDLYLETGIFVSSPLRIDDVGVLAISTNESEESGNIKNTIEYEIIKIDRSPKYKETRFPILPLRQTQVEERLVFTKRIDNATIKDAGALRFCPYIQNDCVSGSPALVKVYKNGVMLNVGSDWEFAFAKGSLFNSGLDWKSVGLFEAADFSEYALSPPKFWIKIKQVDISAVYTVSYTPRTSDYNINIAGTNETDTVWLDSDKTVYLTNGGKVYFKQSDPDVTIESDIYLQITLRRNKISQETSPELYEYSILASSYD